MSALLLNRPTVASPATLAASLLSVELARVSSMGAGGAAAAAPPHLPWQPFRQGAAGRVGAEPPLRDVLGEWADHDSGRNVVAALRQVESVDDLLDLVSNEWVRPVEEEGAVPVANVPAEAVARMSAAGLFLRTFCLDFKQMTFEQMHLLRKQLKDYVTAFDSTTAKPTVSLPQPSRIQIDFFLDECVQQLLDGRCAIAPAALQRICGKITQIAPDMTRVHYVSYLNCIRCADFLRAEDYLHRFYDYAFELSEREQSQYALLGLADLHKRFHHLEEAHEATKEAIRTCRRVGDHECLATALLCEVRLNELQRNVGSEVTLTAAAAARITVQVSRSPWINAPGGPQLAKDEEAQLQASHQRRLVYLQTLQRLATAEERLNSGSSASEITAALAAAGVILDTDTMLLQHHMHAELGLLHNLVAARAWNQFGAPAVSRAFAQQLVDDAAVSQHSSVAQRIEAQCLLAEQLADQGNTAQALEQLQTLHETVPVHVAALESHRWTTALARVLLRTALASGSLAQAEALLLTKMMSPPADLHETGQPGDPSAVEHAWWKASFFAQSRDISRAVNLLSAFTSPGAAFDRWLAQDPVWLLESVLLHAKLVLETSWWTALPLVLRALTLASDRHIAITYYCGLALLGRVLLRTRSAGAAEDALSIVLAAMPHLRGSPVLRARCDGLLALAECQMAVAEKDADGSAVSETYRRQLVAAQTTLTDALAVHEKIGDVGGQIVCLQSLCRVHSALSFTQELQEALAKIVQLS